MSKPWIFMGVDRSHFSAKLRPALRYKQIHHVEYAPDPAEIMRRTGMGFVPILVSPENETLQDTTDIIDVLETRFPSPPLMPDSVTGRLLCRVFELYADEFFPMVSMRTRWAYPDNAAELRKAFAAFSGDRERGERIAGLMSSYLPALGITETTMPAIDAHTGDMLAALSRHFAAHRFLLGDRLSLADCALMGPLYAHLYLDRVTRKMLYDDALEVCMWIERCNRPVPDAMGEWFGDELPETLIDVLALIGADAAPILTALDTAFHAWAAQCEPGEQQLPRGVGNYRAALRGVQFEAGVRSYVPWKMGRARSAYLATGASVRERMDRLLAQTGLASLVAPATSERRPIKRGFDLVLI